MKRSLAGPGLNYECRMVDIRACNGERMLASESLEDNVMAVLAFDAEQREAVRRILGRIAAGPAENRPSALMDLMVLAGLRKLGSVIEREVEKMPILDDIMDHEVLGRERRRGIELGREEERVEVTLRLLAKRFGPIPTLTQSRIEHLSPADLDQILNRIFEASSLDQLLNSI